MRPEVFDTIAGVRERLARVRHDGGSIGFVPTMGALHAGHASLIGHARRASDCVVVSIFVNPLQFDRPDDLEAYPRMLEADLAVCAAGGADVVFSPAAGEMYPAPPVCVVDVSRLGDQLCGRFRPGHFRGMATVVLKLFGIVQPDEAWFGEKDAQQLAIVRRLVADFNVPTRIAGAPTVREADGVALSSRNQRLSPAERRLAPALYRALGEAASRVAAGERDPAAVRQAAAAHIPDDPAVRLEYLEVVDPDDIQPVDSIEGEVLVAGALWIGGTRLIDNIRIGTSGADPAARNRTSS